MEKPFNIIFVYVVWNDIPFQRGKKKGKQEKIGMRSWFIDTWNCHLSYGIQTFKYNGYAVANATFY